MTFLRYILVLCYFFLSTNVVYGQIKNEQQYLNVEEAKKNGSNSEYLKLDCLTDDCDEVIKTIDQFPNLKGLSISNYLGNAKWKNLVSLPNLTKVTIEKSPGINLKKVFAVLQRNNSIKELSLKSNNISNLPSNLKSLTALTMVNISGNNNLDINKALDLLVNIRGLNELYLPINSITELPDNIGTLTSLRILDISNNYLEDLPIGINRLEHLEEINIEGNVILNNDSTLRKLSRLKLKYISLDDGLIPEERERLKKLFPNANIKEVNNNDTFDQMEEVNIQINEDSVLLMKEEAGFDSLKIKNKNKKQLSFGEIKIQQNDLKVYSQAYTHYPRVFGLNNERSFDTTMFEERFQDLTYSNISKVPELSRNSNSFFYHNIVLEFSRSKGKKKKEIWFNFSKTSQLQRKNPEINAFSGMLWVYTGNLSKKEFKHKYIKPKDHKWFQWWIRKYWADFRVLYDNNDQSFIIRLKDHDSFTDLETYPRYISHLRTVEDSQKSYVRRFSKYTSTLQRRKRSFENRNHRNKVRYEKAIKIAAKKRWLSFQKNYMSDEEKKLTKDEWLLYYDRVIANERKAMENASASLPNIERSLELDGYTNRYLWDDSRSTTNLESNSNISMVEPIKSLFKDEDDNILAVKSILIINKDTKTYRRYSGSLSNKSIRLNLIKNSNTAIVIQLRNNHIGYIKGKAFKEINFSTDNKHKFLISIAKNKIATTGMVRKELDL